MSPEMEASFPDDIVEVLQAAGWDPHRRVPIEHWIAALEREGCRSFPAARRFLETFGGLKLAPQLNANRTFQPTDTDLNPVDAAIGERDRIDDWERNYNLSLFPVGSVFGDYAILMITPDEKFYAGSYDSDFLFIANNTEDCLRVVLFGSTPPVPM